MTILNQVLIAKNNQLFEVVIMPLSDIHHLELAHLDCDLNHFIDNI